MAIELVPWSKLVSVEIVIIAYLHYMTSDNSNDIIPLVWFSSHYLCPLKSFSCYSMTIDIAIKIAIKYLKSWAHVI